ncbi:MAG: DsbA family protein [Betaproteobacteria bacterium]|nr:DsbA family protein [Betaproteobacteria bacterium]
MSTPHKNELAVPVTAIDHALGADHAPVTLVEYGDFECPTCKQTAPLLKMLLERRPGRLRVVFRHYPLEGVHPHALLAAQAAEAAAAQGKFWQMHDLLFDNQMHLKIAQLRGYAEQLELDMTRFNAEIGDEVYLQRVREQIEGGNRSNVRATPTVFVNGVIHDTSFGLRALEDAVEALLDE